MDFNLAEDQVLLKDSLTRFLAQRYDFETRRPVIYSQSGWRPEIWTALAQDLGLLGAALPEEAGGLGGGPVETMIIMEALGEALVVEPYLETAVIGAGLLRRVAGETASSLIEGIISGEVRTAFAWTEPTGRYSPANVTTTARREGNGWVLNGAKTVVSAAPFATHLIVSARTSGEQRDREGVSLFLVEAGAQGLTSHDYRTVDDRRASDLTFTDLALPADALLGEAGSALPLIEQVLDEAAAAICAEAVGAMRKLVAQTVDYAKQRKQFGQPIGSFQALQHRMVDMHLALEQSVAAVYLATLTLDAPAAERAKAVSAAKVTIGNCGRFVGQNAVQLHGGMGMTEELPIGHYFKRLSVIENEFGSADHHLARYAALTRPAAA